MRIWSYIEVLALAVFLVLFLRSRWRARRRWRTALNAFAELQIAHQPPSRMQRRELAGSSGR